MLYNFSLESVIILLGKLSFCSFNKINSTSEKLSRKWSHSSFKSITECVTLFHYYYIHILELCDHLLDKISGLKLNFLTEIYILMEYFDLTKIYVSSIIKELKENKLNSKGLALIVIR